MTLSIDTDGSANNQFSQKYRSLVQGRVSSRKLQALMTSVLAHDFWTGIKPRLEAQRHVLETRPRTHACLDKCSVHVAFKPTAIILPPHGAILFDKLSRSNSH